MDYLKAYETYLTTEKKASANTLSSYLRDIGQYLYWLCLLYTSDAADD